MSAPPCAGFVIFTRDQKKVLLICSKKGTFGYPKGKRDPIDKHHKEEPLTAAYRELKEETGLPGNKIEKIDNIYVDEPSVKGNPAIRLFIGIILDEQFKFKPEDTEEIVEAALYPIDQAMDLLMDKRKIVLSKAIELLNSKK